MRISLRYVADPPRVQVSVADMPYGAATLRLSRLTDHGDEVDVRGAASLRLQDSVSVTVTDWDVPVGRDARYHATVLSAGGGKLAEITGVLSEQPPDTFSRTVLSTFIGERLGANVLTVDGVEDGPSNWTVGETVGERVSGPPDPPGQTRTVDVTPGTWRLLVWAGSAFTSAVTVSVTPNFGLVQRAVVKPAPADGQWTSTTMDLTIPHGATTATISFAGVTSQAVYAAAFSPVNPGSIVPPVDCSTAWISNPYDPGSAMLVTLMDGTDDTTSHDMPVSLSQAGRRTNLPSAVVGVRQLGSKRTLIVRCWDLAEAQQFEDLLATSVVLLVRTQQIRHRTGALYVTAGEVSEQRMRQFIDGPDETTWTLSCDEVDPGRLGILASPFSYARSAAYVGNLRGRATYADRSATFPLYSDATKGV